MRLAYTAIKTGDTSLPIELFPTCMHHSDPIGAWDEWENNKFRRDINDASRLWSFYLNRARRLEKLERIRELDPTYCKKSHYNKNKYRIRARFVGL